ncbi:unnamed protein product [Didymodactylos carnosus]|uniref:Uncharacterized protein n=1 Tax=Didymodactylos carnosus TaxID=1234261 RepID=A0A8S2EU03_9BILA|nr:unnamed protein product [Didymodactylos carnosus]CAF4107539.1 unnamed protein product [Didymodactylos carnosus]
MQQRQNYHDENYHFQSSSTSQQPLSPSLSQLNYHSHQQKPSSSRMVFNNSTTNDFRLDMHHPSASSSSIPLIQQQQQQQQQQQTETFVVDNVPLPSVETNVDISRTTSGGANDDETLHMNMSGQTGGIRTQGRIDVNGDHVQQIINVLKENLTSTFPFALILVLKAFYDHSTGILMLVFFSASIYHANTVIVEQAVLKSTRRLFPIIRVISILTVSLVLFLYLFRNEKFYNSFIFYLPIYPKWDLWTLLWVLFSTFCIVKMFVMLLKAVLILLPSNNSKQFISYRNRGCYFSIIEYTSQFYISLLTIRPWIAFILDGNDHSILFSGVMLIFYGIIKILSLKLNL